MRNSHMMERLFLSFSQQNYELFLYKKAIEYAVSWMFGTERVNQAVRWLGVKTFVGCFEPAQNRPRLI
jgi:hypothetical protein